MTKKIRVLIADDHPIVRQGLSVVVAAQPDSRFSIQTQESSSLETSYKETL